MPAFKIRQGSTRQPYVATLRDEEGNLIDLTNTTATFRLKRKGQIGYTVERAMTVVPAVGTPGQSGYKPERRGWKPLPAEVSTPGYYQGEIALTWNDGSQDALYFPTSDIQIEPRL